MAFAPDDPVIAWLLQGDVAIRYQTRRDLLGANRPDLRARIATEGWGAALLGQRNPDGSWGLGFYQPKWTCSHYTLLDLATIGLDPAHARARDSVQRILDTEKRDDGGIGPGKTVADSDVCVNGMFLTYASHFRAPARDLRSIVDFLIGQHMGDGGFNCRSNRAGARHSSMHSTISVFEGLSRYRRAGYGYRAEDLAGIRRDCVEFLLLHKLFRSDRTGKVIDPAFLRLPYPWRWRYNVLRALDAFAAEGVPWDDRMQDAVDVLLTSRRRPDGRWPTNAAHPGAVHLTMDPAGEPGRWNTLIALRSLAHYGKLSSALPA